MAFEFDEDKLRQETEEADGAKRRMAMVGGIGDALASSNSFGNFFLGRMNEKSTAGRDTAKAMSDTIADPNERRAKLYQSYKQAKEAKEIDHQDEVNLRKRDPQSRESKALKALAPRWGIQPTEDMTAEEIEQMIDPKKMMETEAASAVTFDRDKRLKAIDHNYDMAKLAAQKKTAPKGFKFQINEATGEMELVPEKRVLPAETAGKIGNLLGAADTSLGLEQIGGTQPTGKLDAAWDWAKEAVGMQDQPRAKFSADIANQRNSVMSQIAGANVTPDEKSRILEGIPTRVDAPDQFKAKGQSTTDGIIKKAQSEIEALEAAGYDTDKLRANLDKFKASLAQHRSGVKKPAGSTGTWGIDSANASEDDGLDHMSDEEIAKLYNAKVKGKK
jgi:hypothetical protein